MVSLQGLHYPLRQRHYCNIMTTSTEGRQQVHLYTTGFDLLNCAVMRLSMVSLGSLVNMLFFWRLLAR